MASRPAAKVPGRKTQLDRDLCLYSLYRDPNRNVEDVAADNNLSRSGLYKAVWRAEEAIYKQTLDPTRALAEVAAEHALTLDQLGELIVRVKDKLGVSAVGL